MDRCFQEVESFKIQQQSILLTFPSASETGNVELRITAQPLTDGTVNCGGASQDTMTISITAVPSADAGPNQTICEGENFNLVGTRS